MAEDVSLVYSSQKGTRTFALMEEIGIKVVIHQQVAKWYLPPDSIYTPNPLLMQAHLSLCLLSYSQCIVSITNDVR